MIFKASDRPAFDETTRRSEFSWKFQGSTEDIELDRDKTDPVSIII